MASIIRVKRSTGTSAPGSLAFGELGLTIGGGATGNKGERLFLMTPLHHHYELKGFKEEQIVDTFWKINIICMFLVIVLKISF